MTFSIPALCEEHRAIDTALDRFASTVAAGAPDPGILRELRTWVSQHYRREEEYLMRLEAQSPLLAVKMRSQHDEALEIAARFKESLAARQTADVIYLARRFVAIVRHNMIEEERDVFPLLLDP